MDGPDFLIGVLPNTKVMDRWIKTESGKKKKLYVQYSG